jgi:hypothetical protein
MLTDMKRIGEVRLLQIQNREVTVLSHYKSNIQVIMLSDNYPLLEKPNIMAKTLSDKSNTEVTKLSYNYLLQGKPNIKANILSDKPNSSHNVIR